MSSLASGSKVRGMGGEEEDVHGRAPTPLERHAAFFDRNKDGVIYPSETYKGLRAIGAGVALSAVGAVFINGLLAPATKPGKFPSLRFPIYVKNIAKGKHGSDTDTYDEQGRFVLAKFEEIFRKHASTVPDALTSKELEEMLKANRERKDFAGWVGAYAEWKVLYHLCKDEQGLLKKETIQAVYDGSLFEKLEKEQSSASKHRN